MKFLLLLVMVSLFGITGYSENKSEYTDIELMEYAVEYYDKTYGQVPPHKSIKDNGDGTVTIHFYDDFDTHNATWAWYTIDKQTGIGTNGITFEEVNFIQ